MMRREALGVAALATATFAAYAWSAHFWIDRVDEGYFLDMADRVVRGELPYRDFTTYYTPGIFYLFAATFKLFGANLLWPRYLMAALRAATAVLTYLLVRRVAPWPIALLPFAVTALLDHWPIEPEPHPSWPAIVLCLLTLEFMTRYVCSNRLRWLGLAGVSTALCVLFKQNTGAFTAVALASVLVMRPRPRSGLLLKALQAAFALGIAAAISVFLSPLMDGPLALALWLPVLAAIRLAAWQALRVPTKHAMDGMSELFREGGVAAIAFGLVTLAWVIPLAVALGPANIPLALFLGSAVNEASIETHFAAFTGAIRATALLAIWVPTLLVRTRSTLVAAVVLSALVPLLPLWEGPRDELTRDPLLLRPVTWLDHAFGTLNLYLPALAAWAAIAAVATSRQRGPMLWYLLFGSLAALTLFPRTDTLHALVAGPPILVAGASALGQVYCSLKRPLVVAALLILPVAAIASELAWRAANVISPELDVPRLAYAPLDMDRAPIFVPPEQANDIRGVVAFIKANTSPGDPFFAYPVEPLANFLTERPNPTHFDHFLPGTLTDQDFEQVIADLERARPRYVLWNHFDVVVWETDPMNRPLSDYIWRCYEQVETFNLYLVLERRTDAC